ncbi:MAG: hypothetical protein J6U89_06225 [Bacteroidaceae bacterium]|nr:hypothetical protein [Bacteroidaceae bacterium]
MANCVGTIAGNIGLDCEHPIEGGYTGRGILIPMESSPMLTRDANNPRIIVSLEVSSSARVVAVDNEGIAPFDGSASTGNSDAGYARFTKTVVIRLPQRGADFAKNVLEPLVKSGRGFIGVFEKVDQAGDGSFEVIGAQSPLKCVDPSTFTRSETANGGAWSGTLQCTEHFAELVLLDRDYENTLTLFEALLAQAQSS